MLKSLGTDRPAIIASMAGHMRRLGSCTTADLELIGYTPTQIVDYGHAANLKALQDSERATVVRVSSRRAA